MDDSYQERLEKEEKERLARNYRERGFQKQSLNDYLALKRLRNQKKKIPISAAIKHMLTTVFILLFCFGAIFLPYITYQFILGLRK